MSNAVESWIPAYVGVGSNLSGPAKQIEDAFELLADIPSSQFIGKSGLYRSAPFGGVEQPDFINAVAALETQLSARELLEQLQVIEKLRGRERDGQRWGPRVLDLDLLVYGDLEVYEEGLNVPHPGISERNFVLLPLQEIAPDLEIPGLGRIADLAVCEEPEISRIV